MITRDVKDPWRAWKVTGMEEKGGRRERSLLGRTSPRVGIPEESYTGV